MKRIPLIALCLLSATSLFADAGQHLIPAGSLVSCTTGDGKISSRTTAVGDPVLCKVEFKRGDFMLPYGSYLGGEFAEYKDPGHFVGKGWMQLDFDRLYVGDTVIPINAKVVDVPGYKIDAQGRILGKGHEARDITLWAIPVLWPIDLLMLPMRGPRPTLKTETSMTLRVMDDIQIPNVPAPQRDPYGLYQRTPNAYAPEPQQPYQEQNAAPQDSYVTPPQPVAPPAMSYAPAPVPVAPPVVMPYPVPYAYAGVVVAPRPVVLPVVPRAYIAGPGYRAYGYGYGYGGGISVRAGYGYGARVR